MKASAPKIESVEIFEAGFEGFDEIDGKLRNEANIPTVEDSTKTSAWVSKSEFESERAGNISQSPKKRPQTFDSRIIWFHAGSEATLLSPSTAHSPARGI